MCSLKNVVAGIILLLACLTACRKNDTLRNNFNLDDDATLDLTGLGDSAYLTMSGTLHITGRIIGSQADYSFM
ncbi:MAG TPA: hypothetical protein VK628_05720, partial [Flavitalea sp.]|nr:hypothetical protein [Flavitalea sp.]